MALRSSKPNPLNYFGIRKVEFAVPYFKYAEPINKYNHPLVRSIDAWVQQNLNHRYYIGQGIGLDHTNTIIYTTQIGFEVEKELSFFVLACPYIHN